MPERFEWPTGRANAASAVTTNSSTVRRRGLRAERFAFPAGIPGIQYGTLTPQEIAALPAFMRTKLYNPNMGEIVDFGGGDLHAQDNPVVMRAPEDAPGVRHIEDPLKYGNFQNQALSIGLTDVLQLSQPSGGARRIYLFIVNSHPTQNMFMTMQVAASTTLGIPILFNFGFILFDAVVPQDDVHLIANGAATTGMLMFSNKSPGLPGEL